MGADSICTPSSGGIRGTFRHLSTKVSSWNMADSPDVSDLSEEEVAPVAEDGVSQFRLCITNAGLWTKGSEIEAQLKAAGIPFKGVKKQQQRMFAFVRFSTKDDLDAAFTSIAAIPMKAGGKTYTVREATEETPAKKAKNKRRAGMLADFSALTLFYYVQWLPIWLK